MRRIKITYGLRVSQAQLKLEQNCVLSFLPATGTPFIARSGQPPQYLQDNEEFELLIGGYFVLVTLRREGSSHYYCTTEEAGYQGFRIEFPPKDGASIFARKAVHDAAKKERREGEL